MFTTSDEHAAAIKLVIMRASRLQNVMAIKAPSAIVEESRLELKEALDSYYKPKDNDGN